MALGEGNFWQPVYMRDYFYEQPPLIFGLQSLFFRLLGESIYVEKIYSFLVFIVSAFLITKTWKLLFKDNDALKNYTWLPLLCWCLNTCVIFAYPNNLLDTNMAFFDLLAFYFFMKAIYANAKKWFYFSLVSICVILAFFTKGPVGLFPVAFPFIYYLVYNKKKIGSGLLLSLVIASIAALIFGLILQYDSAYVFFKTYFQQQILDSFLGKREKVSSILGHFQIFVWLFSYLLPVLAVLLIALIFQRRKHAMFKIETSQKKLFLFLLLIAISASFPISLSIKQRAFYLIPSFIFYALAFAVLLLPYVQRFVVENANFTRLRDKLFRPLQIAVVLSIFYNIFIFGKTNRDETVIQNTKILSGYLAPGEKIGICLPLYKDWQFKAYLERYSRITTSDLLKDPQYYLYSTKCEAAYLDKIKQGNYKKADLPLKGFTLYEKAAIKN
jgi:4-amino-4-deoxy-L-arabinose transferase-like glycosyltransferase